MASTLIVMGGNFTVAVNNNRYTMLYNGRVDQTFFGITSADITWPAGVTFKRLGCSVAANDRASLSGGDLSGTLYVNGAAQAVKVSWSSGATGLFMDSSNSVAISAGDEVSLRWNAGTGGTGGYTIRTVWIEIEYTSAITIHGNASANALGASGYPILSYGQYGTVNTEANSQMLSIAGDWHDLYQLVASNSRNGDATVDFREGGVTGNQGVIIPASTTGTFIDTATDTVAEDDLVNLYNTRAGSSGTVAVQAGCDFFTSADDRFQIYFSGDLALSPSGATDYYLPLGGLSASTYGDNETRIIWPLADKQLEILDVRITTNSIGSDSLFDLMVNGSAVETITIGASTTGTFSFSGARLVNSGDEVNYRLRAGGSGNITVRFGRSVWGDVPPPSAYDAKFNFRSTSGYVTDGAGETYVLGETSSQTRDDNTFQWGTCGDCSRDRSTGVGSRFAGVNKRPNDGTQNTWTLVTLPAPGWYEVRGAFGDATNTASPTYVEFYDDSTLLGSISGVTASPTTANYYLDAMGNTHANADWDDDNVPLVAEFATTTFKMRIGSSSNVGGETRVAHLQIKETTAPPSGDVVILRRRRS